MSKEAELQNLVASTNKSVKKKEVTYTKEEQALVEESQKINQNIKKRKKQFKKGKCFKKVPGLRKGNGSSLGNIHVDSSKVRTAKAHAKEAAKVPKKKKNPILTIAMVAIIFIALAVGTYFIVSNSAPEKNTISETDISILDTAHEATGSKAFSVPVEDYVLGSQIDRGLRVSNSSKGIGVYVAFSISVKEKVGSSRVDIDLVAEPILQGSVVNPLWTEHVVNGTTYYYSNNVLEASEQVVLFPKYTLQLSQGSSLTLDELAGRTVEVTVTIEVLQENYMNGSTKECWTNAPQEWKDIVA